MIEKWQYMLKIALLWSVIMTGLMLLFDYFDTEFSSTITITKIVVRFIVYFVFGIGLGYLNWRSKEKDKK
ncbi:MAG TPA: hypothetical protein VK623_07765 [Flavobacterium sp.]|nr:hypothetical protein [Flavobacterium sp.]